MSLISFSPTSDCAFLLVSRDTSFANVAVLNRSLWFHSFWHRLLDEKEPNKTGPPDSQRVH